MQRKNEIIELSNDHLPYNHNESIRIIKAGGYIVRKFVIKPEDSFFLIGSDGLFERMNHI